VVISLRPHFDEGPEDDLVLTGSLSAVVAFPAKTRARSRTSCVRLRRTFVFFVNITTSCRPSGLLPSSVI